MDANAGHLVTWANNSETEGPRGDGRRPWIIFLEFDPLAGKGKSRKSWKRKKKAAHRLAGRGEGFQAEEWAKVAHPAQPEEEG